jgi:hypothetical protein
VVARDTSAAAGTTAIFLVCLKLLAVAVIVRANRRALLLLLRSVVCRLLLIVDRLLELTCFGLYLSLLLLFALFHLLFFRQDSFSCVLVQVNIHVLPLFE